MIRNPHKFTQETTQEFNRGDALTIANKVISTIKNQAVAYDVVGSIRRQVDKVHDIDIVVWPRDWFLCSTRCIILASQHKMRASPQLCRFIHKESGIPVELFMADSAQRYEMLKLLRTGDMNFNKSLLRAAFEYDLELNVYTGGLYFERDGIHRVVAWTEEQIICELLDNYVPPEERTLVVTKHNM